MGVIVHRKGGSLFGPLLSLNWGNAEGLSTVAGRGQVMWAIKRIEWGEKCLAPELVKQDSTPAGHGAGASGARRPEFGEALCVSMHIQDICRE